MKKSIFLFLFLLATITHAQKIFSDQNHAWISYLGNHKISNKFGVHTEYQWRRADWFQNWQQSLLRMGMDFYVHPSIFISAGYGWIVTFPYGKQPILNEFNEHRIWQQLNMRNKIECKGKTIAVQHRYRLEQRFMENFVNNSAGDVVKSDNIFRQRFRYRAMVLIPLTKKSIQDNTLFLNINDEIFLGFGKGISKNVLDQNRFNVALGWTFNENLNFQIGYLNQYVIKTDGVNVERNHTLLSSLVYNIAFTHK